MVLHRCRAQPPPLLKCWKSLVPDQSPPHPQPTGGRPYYPVARVDHAFALHGPFGELLAFLWAVPPAAVTYGFSRGLMSIASP